mgnify:CR=1 FL=1
MNKNEVKMRAVIQQALQESASLSTRDAVALLEVSESTVRRLFDKMEMDGIVSRVFGGIRLANTDNKYQYELTMERQRHAKTQIGKLGGIGDQRMGTHDQVQSAFCNGGTDRFFIFFFHKNVFFINYPQS